MLSLNTPIIAADICTVGCLAPGHPVYKLEGFGQSHDSKDKVDTLVIKFESGDTANVAAAAQIMNIVDSNSRQVPLSAAEIAAVREFVNIPHPTSVSSYKASLEVVNTLLGDGTWLKMDYKHLINLSSATHKLTDNGSKEDVRIIAKALRKSGGLERLGEIIAADLFNGSGDRFGYPALLQYNVGEKVVANSGNIFVDSLMGGPIGLDNFDPASQQKFVSDGNDGYNRATAMDLSKASWGGHLLLDANKSDRTAWIKLLVADLEHLLGAGQRNRRSRFSSQNRLGTGRTVRVSKGMDKGAKKLRKKISEVRAQRPLKTGIDRKMTALGW